MLTPLSSLVAFNKGIGSMAVGLYRRCGGVLAVFGLAAGASFAQTAEPAQPPAQMPPATPTPDGQTPPQDEEQERPPIWKLIRFGPNANVYFPSSGKTRDRFGDAWFGFGLGVGPVRQSTKGGRQAISVDVGVYNSRRRRGDGRALFIPLGLSYRQGVETGNRIVPYLGASANVNVVSMRSDQDNVSPGLRAGLAASGILGVSFGDSAFFEGRYLAASKIRGFDLSGLRLSAGVRF